MDTSTNSRQGLTKKIETHLRKKISTKYWVAGDRLPTEHELANQYDVSRTVIREAVSRLKLDKILASRQGSGVFVIEHQQKPVGLEQLVTDPSILSSVIEALELREAVEAGAAGLAAQRRSPAQEANIYTKFNAYEYKIINGEDSEEEDFAFHLAIAEASNNKKFIEFLTIIGQSIIPQSTLRAKVNIEHENQVEQNALLEHRDILKAISSNDVEASRAAMHKHLSKCAENYHVLSRLTKEIEIKS